MERKVDPGWNDPPMLNYSSSNPPPKSRITNKRVAFPLNTTSIKSQPVSSVDTPHLASIPPITKSDIPSEIFSSECNVSGDLLNPMESDLSTFIKNEQDRQIFVNLWKEDKFPSSCKEYIALLCKCLKEGKVENIKSIKAKLLTEYTDLCDMWIKSIEA